MNWLPGKRNLNPESIFKKVMESEIIRYGVSGGLVTFINMAGYFLLLHMGVFYTAANMISIILSKTAGYFLNKFFVYRSKNESRRQDILEFLRFVLARGFTGMIDFFGVIVLVEYIGAEEYRSKMILMVQVILLNYILGKKAVFKKRM